MFWQPKLIYGAGNIKWIEKGLCLMQMVSWFSGDKEVTDHPACADPILATVGRCLNDHAPSQEDRDSLWPLVWMLIGSHSSKFIHQRDDLKQYVANYINVLFHHLKYNSPNKANQIMHPQWLELKTKFEEAILAGPHGDPDPTAFVPKIEALQKIMEPVDASQ